MNAPYVLVGVVRTASGATRVHVDPMTGMIVQSFSTKDGRYKDSSTSMGRSTALELVALLNRAVAVAPIIKAAHDVRVRASAGAEATYERIVKRAIGGAQ